MKFLRGFKVTAVPLDDNVVMGIRHKRKPIEGVQSHPESVLSEWESKEGLKLSKTSVEMTK